MYHNVLNFPVPREVLSVVKGWLDSSGLTLAEEITEAVLIIPWKNYAGLQIAQLLAIRTLFLGKIIRCKYGLGKDDAESERTQEYL